MQKIRKNGSQTLILIYPLEFIQIVCKIRTDFRRFTMAINR